MGQEPGRRVFAKIEDGRLTLMSGEAAMDEARAIVRKYIPADVDLSGGLIEDLKLGLGALIQHHSAFKRIAVVSDKDWVVHALHAFAWMVPGELKLFGLDELERAKEWAAGLSRRS